jgi:hypothetical protein
MTALQRLIPVPHLLEVHRIDVAAPALDVWDDVRLGELSQPVAIRALFKLRTLASRKGGRTAAGPFRLDSMRSSPESPGFQVLSEEPRMRSPLARSARSGRSIFRSCMSPMRRHMPLSQSRASSKSRGRFECCHAALRRATSKSNCGFPRPMSSPGGGSAATSA